MPSIILSHQAPAIFIKTAWPKWFDGAALCIAATAPDFELVLYRLARYFMDSDNPWHWGISHSLVGVVVYVIPVTLAGTFLFSRWIGPWCASLAVGKGRVASWLIYFGVDQWSLFKKKQYTLRWFFVASYSAVVGAATHLILDIFTHKDIHLLFPFRSVGMPDFLKTRVTDLGMFDIGIFQYELYLDVARIFWLIISLVTAGVSLWGLRYIKKNHLIEQWYSNDIV
ncbi:MAG: DUF4184 family protein [Kiritimatiellae bacterium]|jgi:membrane-bound metal-dependent hydrolase YbcI (DUF457 family)|nr:DUF4184 family protein [Kiritimatiellia bacterium]